MSPAEEAADLLEQFGDRARRRAGQLLADRRQADRPGDASAIRTLAASRAAAAFLQWRTVPAPRRGELVRLLGEELRAAKPSRSPSWSRSKAARSSQESLGEVQEMIDICDFAVGLSRQLYGLTIASERPNHRMMEQWHPLGPVLVISAFNFPVAVWAWNAALALVCGNPVIWKPSEKTPLCAEAVMALVRRALTRFGDAPDGLVQLVQGEPRRRRGAGRRSAHRAGLGDRIDRDGPRGRPARRAALRPGAARARRQQCDDRLPVSADLELAARAILFSAAGTAGQRCTTLRRLIVHESIADELVERLRAAVRAASKVGDPREPDTLIGPLIDEAAFEGDEGRCSATRSSASTRCRAASTSARRSSRSTAQEGSVLKETFAPILYVLRYRELDEAIALNNAVPQGLSSSIFTNDLREAERFMSAAGSDCGIANVNIGPSGAEIGGAFGGEKETGGGRESGSDSWRAYMRRQTNTINYGSDLPLAQGIRFDVAP